MTKKPEITRDINRLHRRAPSMNSHQPLKQLEISSLLPTWTHITCTHLHHWHLSWTRHFISIHTFTTYLLRNHLF